MSGSERQSGAFDELHGLVYVYMYFRVFEHSYILEYAIEPKAFVAGLINADKPSNRTHAVYARFLAAANIIRARDFPQQFEPDARE